jgi:hypothetical protein
MLAALVYLVSIFISGINIFTLKVDLGSRIIFLLKSFGVPPSGG